MYLTKSNIFWKCWLWSVICGIITAALFWAITSFGNFFHGPYGGTVFIDLLLSLSIAGCYFGAGYVGARIANKYYHDTEKRFIKRYFWYSLLSFIVLVAVVYSPVSFLGILWSLIAPLCVLAALSKIEQQSPRL